MKKTDVFFLMGKIAVTIDVEPVLSLYRTVAVLGRGQQGPVPL